MSKNFPQLADDLSKAIGTLRKGIKPTMQGFSSMAQAAMTDDALDPKTKELIATGIAIAVRCDGCIAFHVKAARKSGATREELLETIATAVYMGGGPSMIYGAQTLEAWDQYEEAEKA